MNFLPNCRTYINCNVLVIIFNEKWKVLVALQIFQISKIHIYLFIVHNLMNSSLNFRENSVTGKIGNVLVVIANEILKV